MFLDLLLELHYVFLDVVVFASQTAVAHVVSIYDVFQHLDVLLDELLLLLVNRL